MPIKTNPYYKLFFFFFFLKKNNKKKKKINGLVGIVMLALWNNCEIKIYFLSLLKGLYYAILNDNSIYM